jgi:2-methylcitrate dehydratase PrpD
VSDTYTRRMCDHLAAAANTPLPDDVAAKTALHILDTLAAGISGSRLPAGQRGLGYAQMFPAAGSAALWGSTATSDALTAAFVNGMASHADETDDSHAPSVSHPGCGVVPAAVALADSHGASGDCLLRAVAAGYDIGTRVNIALGRGRFGNRAGAPSSHACASLFGAAAAGIVVLGMDPERAMTTLAYATQMASGVNTWLRDPVHVEKAFVFAGMPSRNGVFATLISRAGWESVPDSFDYEPDFLTAYGSDPQPKALVAGLGSEYAVMETNIKKYAVGSPAQAPVQATEDLIREHALTADQVSAIEILLPAHAAYVVDNRETPDISVQYLVAGTLLDGGFTFAMAHDDPRMDTPDIQRLRQATTLTADESTRGTRSGTVIVRTTDGRELRAVVSDVRGTAQNPMTPAEVEAKCIDLLRPVLGQERTRVLIDRVLGLPGAADGSLGELTQPA